MDERWRQGQIEYLELVETLKASDLPDLDRVAQVFDFVINQHVGQSQRDIELARAMRDKETMVKEQIKQETLKYAHRVFNDTYMVFKGRRVFDEQE